MTTNNLAQVLDSAIDAQYLEGRIYTVDFDQIWEALGYQNRSSAARCVLYNLIQGTDFISMKNHEAVKNWRSKDPLQKIWLTVEGFVLFGLLAKNEQGRNLRLHYIKRQQLATTALERAYNVS